MSIDFFLLDLELLSYLKCDKEVAVLNYMKGNVFDLYTMCNHYVVNIKETFFLRQKNEKEYICRTLSFVYTLCVCCEIICFIKLSSIIS